MRTRLYLCNFEQEYWRYLADMAGKEDALKRLNAAELKLIRHAQAQTQTVLSHDAVIPSRSKLEKSWLLLAVFSGLAVFAFINRGILQPVTQKKLANRDELVTVSAANKIPWTNTIIGINTRHKQNSSGRMLLSKTNKLSEQPEYLNNQLFGKIFSHVKNNRESGLIKSSLPSIVESIFLLPRQLISTTNNKHQALLERRFRVSSGYDRKNALNSVADAGASLVSAGTRKYFNMKQSDNTGIEHCLKPLVFVSGTTPGNKTQLLADITLLENSLTRLQLNLKAAKRKTTVTDKIRVDNNQFDNKKNKPDKYSEKSAQLRLPFKPLAVDWFNHEAVLGVRYKGSYAYLHHGQVFKGWKLIRINENEIIFESKISGIKRILY